MSCLTTDRARQDEAYVHMHVVPHTLNYAPDELLGGALVAELGEPHKHLGQVRALKLLQNNVGGGG